MCLFTHKTKKFKQDVTSMINIFQTFGAFHQLRFQWGFLLCDVRQKDMSLFSVSKGFRLFCFLGLIIFFFLLIFFFFTNIFFNGQVSRNVSFLHLFIRDQRSFSPTLFFKFVFDLYLHCHVWV